MTEHAKCHDCKQLFALGEMHLIKANNLSGRAYLCDPCHVAEVESIRTFNISLHKDRAMTEPSKQAWDLALTEGSAEGLARRIDAALAEARQEAGEKWRQQWLDDTNRLEDWQEQDESKIGRLTAERDELAATVERVQALADAMERDHAKDDASSGGWFFATEAAIEGLRDALNGGESDE